MGRRTDEEALSMLRCSLPSRSSPGAPAKVTTGAAAGAFAAGALFDFFLEDMFGL